MSKQAFLWVVEWLSRKKWRPIAGTATTNENKVTYLLNQKQQEFPIVRLRVAAYGRMKRPSTGRKEK